MSRKSADRAGRDDDAASAVMDGHGDDRSAEPLHNSSHGPPSPQGEELRRAAPLVCGSDRPSRRTSRTAFAAAPPEGDDLLLQFEPYLHPAPRRNSITPERQRAFIAALAASGIVTQAGRAIGVSLEALYKLRRLRGAEGFAAAWEAALDRGVERLEDCALALALQGEELPIASGGHLLGSYRKQIFGHIRFVLSQRRAARWSVEGGNFASLRPGHPVYDRLRREWEQERARAEAANSEAVIQSLNAKLQLIADRRAAHLAAATDRADAADGVP